MVSSGMNVAWPARWLRIYWVRGTLNKRTNTEERSYLDTVDGRLLLIHDHSIDVPAQDSRHREFVLALCRFAQIDDTATHAGEDPLQVRKGLLELGFALRLFLVDASLEQLVMHVYKLLVNFLLELAV